MADLCPVCKFPIERHEQPGYVGEPFCSEFCAVATADQKAAFTAGLPDGEFVLYPCAESGCAIEDGYTPGTCCSSCSPKRKARVRGELLERARAFLFEYRALKGSTFANELIDEIDVELKR